MLRQTGLYAAWLIALIATLGSLYFSEVRLFIPCTYCWYQRILMYPLVILLGIASYRQDHTITIYTLPLSILGMGIATYHYLGQKIPDLISAGGCSSAVPCSHAYINWAGFITIPFLSLTAFTLITLCLVVVAFGNKGPSTS
jgi:disulfide bond formation protein DsbB